MKKINNKFLESIIILIFSGMATKVLGLIIKIIFTRIVGPKAISLYTLVMPTYSLILTIASFAMPNTISKLISEKEDSSIINTATIIILVLNFIIIFIMFLISPFIANTLLKQPNTYYLLIAMSLTLPFASVACILKGYFYGIQKMKPHMVSNFIEQIIRLILILTVIPILSKISYVHAACGLILTSTVTEFASVICFLLYMNNNERINLKKLNYSRTISKEIINLSMPTVSSKIISNICFFFEPIVLTYSLLKNGYSKEYIIMQYGIYNAYSISTLLIPSFFINAIALALLPETTKLISKKNYTKMKKRLKQGFISTIILGSIFSFFIFSFKNSILKLLYNTTNGSEYIKILAPIFILFYLENIFSTFFQAIGKTKISFKISIISSIIKLLSMYLLSYLKIGIYCLIYAEIIDIIIIIILDLLYYKKEKNKLITSYDK